MRMRFRCYGTTSRGKGLALELTTWRPIHLLASKAVAESQSCLLMVAGTWTVSTKVESEKIDSHEVDRFQN